MAELSPFEKAARRKTKANCKVRRLTELLAEAQKELAAASEEFAELKHAQPAGSAIQS